MERKRSKEKFVNNKEIISVNKKCPDQQMSINKEVILKRQKNNLSGP